MEWERPKSSALTMRRRPDCGLRIADCGFERDPVISRRAIIRSRRSQNKTQPRLENQRELVRLAQFQRSRAEDIEAVRFEFLQQPPVNQAHQFSSHHGAPVLRGQHFAGEAIKIFSAAGNAGGKIEVVFGVLALENFVFGHVEFFQLGHAADKSDRVRRRCARRAECW